MKCNLHRWLWGVVPLAGLAALMHVNGALPGIEADLKRQTEAALAASGQTWLAMSFSGRDAVIAGEAVENNDKLRAARIVHSVWGLRKLDDQTKLLDEERNYVWAAQLRNGNKLRLSGFVPNPQARQAIIGAARATFPGLEIDDRMKLARGVPNLDVWIGGIGFGFKQLAGLKTGAKVDLDGTSLAVEGEAEDLNSYKGLKTALQTGIPQGIRLKADKVTPPVVRPYTWSARLAGSQLQLTGHVPSEGARDEIAAGAKRAFPKAAVVDRQQIAAGEPKDWLQGALAALAKLGRLEEGSADIRDQQLTLNGLASDEAIASDIRRTAKSDIPASFKTADSIRVKEPAVKTIDPFVTTAEAAGNVVTFTGYAPSAAARAALIEAAKTGLPGLRVDDRLEIAAGAPDTWQACAQAGLQGLARIKDGRMQISGRALDLFGSTDDESLSQNLASDVRGAAGSSCATNVRVVFAGIPAAELQRRVDAAAAEAAARKATEEETQRRVAAEEAAQKARVAAAQTEQASKAAPAAGACETLLTQVKREGVINFKRASADIDAQSNATLDRLVQVMGTCENARVEVQGHTDAEGTPERKQNLSNRRAQSILAYLTGAGVDPARLTAAGYGDARPVAPNDTPENRAKNRRIEFEVKVE